MSTEFKAERPIGVAQFAHQASRGEFVIPPHVALWDALLTRIMNGESRRLIIEGPVRHGKSLLTCRWFPAYFLGMNPTKRFLLLGNSDEFASRWGRLAFETFSAYAPKFFGVKPSATKTSASEWETEFGGGMMSAGVGGNFMGVGFHCLVGETPVETEFGAMPIDTLCRLQDRPRVRSYCHQTGETRWSRVKAAQESVSDELYEIRTVGGRVIRATGEHHFYVPKRGYQPARDLARGDRLVLSAKVAQEQSVQGVRRCGNSRDSVLGLLSKGSHSKGQARLCLLWRRLRATAARVREVVSAATRPRVLLRPGMLGRASRGQERQALRHLRKADAGQVRQPILRSRVSARCRAWPSQVQAQGMPGLFGRVSPHYQSSDLLFTGMREQGALRQNDREREFTLQRRQESRAVVHADATADSRARRIRMLCVRRRRDVHHQDHPKGAAVLLSAADSPRRRERGEQRSRESRDHVPVVSPEPPSIGYDAVAMVRRLRDRGVRVYDIEVEDDHNFFAGEVLVHNCIGIDDIFKNAELANSEREQERVFDWLKGTVYYRQEPGCAIVVTNARWNDYDLIGRIKDEMEKGGEHWDVCTLSARAGEDDILDRQPGQALWPERFDEAELDRMEANDPYYFAAQWQAQPSVRQGGMFEEAWFKPFKGRPKPEEYEWCRYWDLAASEGKGDYTAGMLVGLQKPRFASRTERQIVLWDLAHGRWGPKETDMIIKETAKMDRSTYGSVIIRGEQEPGSSGKRDKQAFINMLQGYDVDAERNSGEKRVRARPLSRQAAAGNLYIRDDAPWKNHAIREFCAFDKGKNDDIVDAGAGGYNELVDTSVTTFGDSPAPGHRGRRARAR